MINLKRSMMKTKIVTLISLSFLIVSCVKKAKEEVTDEMVVDSTEIIVKNEHNAKNSLDYIGQYQGIVPCADCEGIETSLLLEDDKNYVLKTNYLGRKNVAVNEVRGLYSWNEAGNTIILSGIENAPNQYFVSENYLTQLDLEGHKISGELAAEYVLHKKSVSEELSAISTKQHKITGVKWKLVELNGKPVTHNANKEMFIQLNKDNRYAAFAGCNQMTGGFELNEDALRIKFTKGTSTLMACPDMTTEQEFAETLEKVDNYSINGNNLSLNRARMAPLARFEAIK